MLKSKFLTIILVFASAARAAEPRLPAAKPAGQLELVATFTGAMPTGVTVTRSGRAFVNFPQWGEPVGYTVAELKDGKPVPFPDAEINRYRTDRPQERLVSVQSVVVDPADRLWLLDTGSIEFGPPLPGGAKLVCVDLATNKVVKTITFPPEVALKTTYLNDVRFDLRQGAGGVAYITDSAQSGPNGLIVVDLDSGRSWRRLHDHPATKADPKFLPWVEGRPLMTRTPGQTPAHMTMGSDGIALSRDGAYLYFCPLSSRRLHRVATAALRDGADPGAAAKAVEDLGDRGFASDGLEADDQGRLYLTDYEHNAIVRRGTEGQYETLACDQRLLWPDTLSLAADGYLYVTTNQLHRQKQFHEGRDLREKPYALFRIKVDAGPVLLGREK
jgi:sugar lactone lactonase YvrE